MKQHITIGTWFGVDVRLHWSWPVFPVAVAGYSLIVFPWIEAALFTVALLSIYFCVLIHEGAEAVAAWRLGIRTRSVTLYPFWGVDRLERLSERPWQEKRIAAIGLIVLALLAAAASVSLVVETGGIALPSEPAEWNSGAFLVRLFWAILVLTGIHLLPVLPFDGGRILRAWLAMRSSRSHATEIMARVATIGAGVLMVVAILLLKSPLLAATAVLIFLAAQEELDMTRYFERLRRVPDNRKPAAMVPIDQVVTPDSKPAEPNYSGFTWNAEAGLWIEWRAGQPIAANALIGDSRP
jgi:Zn-dependent protease